MFAGSQKGCGSPKENYLKKGHSQANQRQAFFQFARSYEGRNIWTTDSKQSQGPSQIIQCSVSGNAVGISCLTQRKLNQETVFGLLCRKTQIQSKNSCQGLHVLELRIHVLVLICLRCCFSKLEAGVQGNRAGLWESLITKFSPYASDERSQLQLSHTSPAITVSGPLNCQQ